MFRERIGSTDNSSRKKKYKGTERKHPAADVIHPVYRVLRLPARDVYTVQLTQLPTLAQTEQLGEVSPQLPVIQDTCPVISHKRISVMS